MGSRLFVVLVFLTLIPVKGYSATIEFSHRVTHTLSGVPLNFPVKGNVTTSIKNNLTGDVQVDIDLGELQSQLYQILKKEVTERNECGNNVTLKHAVLSRETKASAKANVRIEYQKWYCTYMDVPQIHGFSVKWVRKRTSKNRVIESGVISDLRISPFIKDGSTIGFKTTVVKVHLVNDLVRFIKDQLMIDLKSAMQSSLNSTFNRSDTVAASIPKEISPFVSFDSIEFIDSKNLMLRVTGNFHISTNQTP